MPIDLPASPGFTRSRFGLETNTQTFESPLTRNVQRVLLGGARWAATYTLPRMNRHQAAAWQAFSFKPALRASPANNAPLTVTSATCTMILTDDAQAMWESDHNGIYEPMAFSAVEVF